MKLEREIDIAASPEAVYDKLADPDCLEHWVTIQDALEEAPEGDLTKGARLVQCLKVAGKRFRVAWHVDEAKRPQLLEWTGEGPMGTQAHVRYELKPNGNGTHFTYVNEYELPGGLAGRALGGALKGAAGREADKTLERLKKLLEGS